MPIILSGASAYIRLSQQPSKDTFIPVHSEYTLVITFCSPIPFIPAHNHSQQSGEGKTMRNAALQDRPEQAESFCDSNACTNYPAHVDSEDSRTGSTTSCSCH